MKILSVNNTADVYGSARCIERVFGRFAQEGHEVYVVLPEHGPIVKLLEMSGVHVEIHRGLPIVDRRYIGSVGAMLRFVVMFPVSVFRLAALINRHNIDVVHTNTVVLPTPGMAAWLTRRPHVWHIRELLSEFPMLWKFYQRYMDMFSSAIVAISQCVRDHFDVSIQNKVEVIYDGLREDAGEVNSERRMAFRSLLPSEKKLIGVVGRIKFHRKGQEVLVHAASLLKEQHPEAHYVVVGSTSPGNESHEIKLRKLISDLNLDDQFSMMGETEDPMAAFSALDVAVVPSIQLEPFGCVVSEAMSTGTPVVGSRAGGIAEQIVDRESGLLFTPGDPDSLAKAIHSLLSEPDLYAQLSQNGILRVREAFPFESTYSSMKALFERVINIQRVH
jgi:glycosyltransferase involved in cell wall biosynthesis